MMKDALEDTRCASMMKAIGKIVEKFLFTRYIVCKTDVSGLIDNNTERFHNPVIQPAYLTLNPEKEILSIFLDLVKTSQLTHFYGKNVVYF